MPKVTAPHYIVLEAVADRNDSRLVGMAAQCMGVAVNIHVRLANTRDHAAHLFIKSGNGTSGGKKFFADKLVNVGIGTDAWYAPFCRGLQQAAIGFKRNALGLTAGNDDQIGIIGRSYAGEIQLVGKSVVITARDCQAAGGFASLYWEETRFQQGERDVAGGDEVIERGSVEAKLRQAGDIVRAVAAGIGQYDYGLALGFQADQSQGRPS